MNNQDEIKPNKSSFDPLEYQLRPKTSKPIMHKDVNLRCYHFFDLRDEGQKIHPCRIPVENIVRHTNGERGPLLPRHFKKITASIQTTLYSLDNQSQKREALKICTSPEKVAKSPRKKNLKLDYPQSVSDLSIFRSPCFNDKVNIHTKSPYSPIGFSK